MLPYMIFIGVLTFHSSWLVIFTGSLAVWKYLVFFDKNIIINCTEFAFNYHNRIIICAQAKVQNEYNIRL